jgi:hypothetical protein
MTMTTPADVEKMLQQLRANGFDLRLAEPVAGDAADRISCIEPHFGSLQWQVPPSYGAFLAVASALKCIDDSGRGLVVFDAAEMTETNADLVHLPGGVDRGDGIALSTNHLVGFASARHEAVWCFDISSPDAQGEYPIYYHHQDAPRTKVLSTGQWEAARAPEFTGFGAWLAAHVEALCSTQKPAWWNDLGVPRLWQWNRF